MIARCISCGCTDDRACSTPTGACWWIIVDYDIGNGLCSGCATLEQLLVRVLPWPYTDGATIRELVDRTGRRKTAVWEALTRLEHKGLAERAPTRTAGAGVWYRVVPA